MEAAAAASARSRSSAKALSRGEMSIIGEDEVVEEVVPKGEVGLISRGNFVLFKDEVNMACCSNMANLTKSQSFICTWLITTGGRCSIFCNNTLRMLPG